MPRIILIETSTALCSAAIEIDGKEVCARESTSPRAHASLTARFIKEMLDESGLKVQDCDAVCISSGPGSYTGLRVGSSTAKGLCFGAGIPLIAVNTLDLLVCQAITQGLVPEGCRYIIPMVDARRMEVYTAVYVPDASEPMKAGRISEIEPRIIDSSSFSAELGEGPVLFTGDGVEKCTEVLSCANARFVQTNPEAGALTEIAEYLYKEKRFENTAYFEPFYLKDFVATVSRKKLF